jgi:hypothetical protein
MVMNIGNENRMAPPKARTTPIQNWASRLWDARGVEARFGMEGMVRYAYQQNALCLPT